MPKLYGRDYTRQELEPWARHIQQQSVAGRDAYAYFNNDVNVRAPANARLLMELAGPAAVQPLATRYLAHGLGTPEELANILLGRLALLEPRQSHVLVNLAAWITGNRREQRGHHGQ